MKFLLASLILASNFFFGNIFFARAQTSTQPTWISFDFGQQEYYGDLGNEMMQFRWGYDWALGIAVNKYLGSHWDLELSTTYGELDYDTFFNRSFANANLLLQLKPVRGAFQPYLGTGVGFITFWENSTTVDAKGSAFQLPLQGGIDFRLSDRTILTTSATYNRTFSDEIDGFNMDDRDHDDFIVYSIGIKIALKKRNDPDRDGVNNKRDLCPNEYGESFWGCPDTDRDGVINEEDDCPTLAGSSTRRGCPDSDRDGVIDLEDDCPEIPAGTTGINGCPSEALDDSTESAAVKPVQNEGADKLRELEQELEHISGNILFENATAELDTSSYDDLNQLSELMEANTNLRLIIRVHTDSAGNSTDNLQLSVAQADAIKQFLLNLGIETERIYPFGYGDARPTTSGEVPVGSRQVELVPYYPR